MLHSGHDWTTLWDSPFPFPFFTSLSTHVSFHFGAALAGWGMTGAAIYDSQFSGPEKISLTMTPVMIV